MSAELCSAGYEVFGTGSQTIESSNYYQADLSDILSLASVIEEVRPDVVVHLAALAFVAHGDAEALYKVNLIGTRNLLEALSQSTYQPSKVLVASSANVYGNQNEGLLTELSPVAPANDYAVSKLAMEFLAKTYIDRLPIVIARPFNYTGVGQDQKFLIPKIVKHFRQRAPNIELGNVDVWRDFNDVRSVVRAYCGLIGSGVAGQTYNIASGTTYSLREVIDLCTELTGHAIQISVNPAFVRANEVKTLSGDISKLRAVIADWNPLELRETLSWMLS
ncbi:MAG: GDP-mannose 4,6-dehydratase [Oceanospirillaceae bacterium]|nr:GDP-mannose 4,6-dehydratase [Oceanospirillaceae bacterium]